MQHTMTLATMALLASLVTAPAVVAQESAPQGVEGYAWAGACQECHEAIHTSWAATKHATAINRLNSDERKGSQCIGCHVTGPKQAVMVEGKQANGGVQCEECHGPAKAHIDAARAGNVASVKLTRKAPAALCQTCHNEKSPHYRGFYYNALVGLVHRK